MKIISVIIPCYNEAGTVETLIEKISAIPLFDWQLELIIVDDGSLDGTPDILKKYEQKFKVIYHQKNKGKGSAVKTGISHASGNYILIQDADLEYDPNEIPFLLNALSADSKSVVYGSRNLHYTKRRGTHIPRLGVWFITKEFNLLYGTHLTDLWTCYKLFPQEAASLFVAGRFESELIFSARLIKKGYKITEIPISHKPRTVKEGKKIRYRDGLRGIWALLSEFFQK